MILTKYKIVITGVILGGALVLSACGSHKNPLLAQSKKDTLAFLNKAEATASIKTHVFYASGVYSECVNNPNNFDGLSGHGVGIKRCDKLFNAMIAVAKKTSQFKHLTVKDLKDKAVQKRFGSALME